MKYEDLSDHDKEEIEKFKLYIQIKAAEQKEPRTEEIKDFQDRIGYTPEQSNVPKNITDHLLDAIDQKELAENGTTYRYG